MNRNVFKIIKKFAVSLLVMAIVCTIIWQELVTDRLYNCTDPLWLDFLKPGDWIHGHIAVVQQIVANRPMSEPDTIKEGWSVAGLWHLWDLFTGIAFIISLLFALIPRIPRSADD